MKDVMLDLETFGTGPNACIVQIGGAYFDRDTGEVGKTFFSNVDAGSSVKSGGVIDADTVYWWVRQSEAARNCIGQGAERNTALPDVLQEFNHFLIPAERIWSHATFDFVVLNQAYVNLGYPPLAYRCARDIRTLMDLAELSTKDFVNDGTTHHALDDCRFQIKYCVAAFNKLRGSP